MFSAVATSTSSYDALRRHDSLPSAAAARGGRHRCCFCRRRSCFVAAMYVAAVLLCQNMLIAYHVAMRQQTPPLPKVSHVAITLNTTMGRHRTAVAVPPSPVRTSVQQPASAQPASVVAEKEYYKRREQKVNEYRHNTVLVPGKLCRSTTFMVVLVHSSPTNVDRREAIRVTWGEAVRTGKWPNIKSTVNVSTLGQLQIAFVLGLHSNDTVNRAVREEHAKHDDIIMGNFIDSYRNMTLKSLLDLKVVDERCPTVRYLLKSDDDMVINFPYLLEILAGRPLKRSIMGPYNPRSRVHRDGVWKLTTEEFPFVFYPPYESGSAYVISGDLIHELFATAEYVPHIFVDDVYVTGILGRVLKVTHVRQRGFAYWGTRMPTACDLMTKRIITGTKMHPQRLWTLWNDLNLNPKC